MPHTPHFGQAWCPRLSIRPIAALLDLKHAFNLFDEKPADPATASSCLWSGSDERQLLRQYHQRLTALP